MDFLLTVKGKPWVAVEAKLSGTSIDPALIYFRDRLKIPFVYQVVLDGRRMTIGAAMTWEFTTAALMLMAPV